MSRSLKRGRPETDPPGLVDGERAILNVIKSKKDIGIWARDIKHETKLPDHVVTKSLKSLLTKKLIKEVVNIQYKGKKHYMAVEFESSKEISGGDWFDNGNLDTKLIEELKETCVKYMRARKVVTLDAVHNELKKIVTFEISNQQVGEILNSLVLDNAISEVKSNGLGDYHSIPIGTVCYRVSVAKGPRMGAFASMPCGPCPQRSLCTPDGVISPSTCVYYAEWLNLDF
ncbi:hypothetical protein BUALT_Bualt10G0076500 [Buddleja alternifolia]|uniref:DNA-directed RNA polymerase III subunit RPC6 n=1 Tax=Buddleja alternifolia TaxID=168488 RepID=A0AAV6WXZ6_9LAMI|nr:hypothetical protein BUALT_Bualt10G0076500 [Buddleja alternifolia]